MLRTNRGSVPKGHKSPLAIDFSRVCRCQRCQQRQRASPDSAADHAPPGCPYSAKSPRSFCCVRRWSLMPLNRVRPSAAADTAHGARCRRVERKVEDSTETDDSTKVEGSTKTEDSTKAGVQEWGTGRMTVRRRDAAPEPTWTYSRRVSSTVPHS